MAFTFEKFMVGGAGIPLILPDTVEYGTDTIDGIIGDTDSLPLEAFTRTPLENDRFSFLAKTRKGDVANVSAKATGQIITKSSDGSKWAQFIVESATLLHPNIIPIEDGGTGASTADGVFENLGLKVEEWTFLVENADGTTSPITKKVCVRQ